MLCKSLLQGEELFRNDRKSWDVHPCIKPYFIFLDGQMTALRHQEVPKNLRDQFFGLTSFEECGVRNVNNQWRHPLSKSIFQSKLNLLSEKKLYNLVGRRASNCVVHVSCREHLMKMSNCTSATQKQLQMNKMWKQQRLRMDHSHLT